MSAKLSALVEEMAGQHNHGIAHPVFVVERRSEVGPIEEGEGDEHGWYSTEEWDRADDTKARRLDALHEDMRDTDRWGFHRVEYKYVWHLEAVYFTAASAEAYCAEMIRRHGEGTWRWYAKPMHRSGEVRAALALLRPILGADALEAQPEPPVVGTIIADANGRTVCTNLDGEGILHVQRGGGTIFAPGAYAIVGPLDDGEGE